MEMEDSKSVLIIAPSDRKFRVDIKSNSSQSDLELIKISFEDICLKDFALKQIVDSSDSHFIFKKFDPLFKCEVEITDKDVIEHGCVLHVTIISSVLANLSKLPGTSSANDNETLSKTEETILPITENQASTSKPSLNTQPANQNMQSIQSFITGCLPTLSNSTIKSVMKILVESGVQAVDDLKEIDPEKQFNGVLKVIHARKLKEAIKLASKNGPGPSRNVTSILTRIQEDIKQIKADIAILKTRQIEQPDSPQNAPAISMVSDLSFPLSTFQDLKRAEDFLSASRQNFLVLVKYLSCIGGNSLKSCTHSILQRVMRNCLAQKFNFCGTGKKEGFSKLKLCSAIICAVRICYKGNTDNNIIDIIKNWLKHAPRRKMDVLAGDEIDGGAMADSETGGTVVYLEKMSSDSESDQNENVKISAIRSTDDGSKFSAISIGEILNSVKNDNIVTFNDALKKCDFTSDNVEEINQISYGDDCKIFNYFNYEFP